MEDSRKSREHGMSLLLHGGKITANAAESGGPSRTAKGASHLLLHFGHPKVALPLVVRKRNAQVVEQGQDLLGSGEQGIRAGSWPCFVWACLFARPVLDWAAGVGQRSQQPGSRRSEPPTHHARWWAQSQRRPGETRGKPHA